MEATDLYELLEDEEITIKRFEDEIVIIATKYSEKGNNKYFGHRNFSNTDGEYTYDGFLHHQIRQAIGEARLEFNRKEYDWVICVSDSGPFNNDLPITKGSEYMVLNEGTSDYVVENDYGDEGAYNKSHFKQIDKEG